MEGTSSGHGFCGSQAVTSLNIGVSIEDMEKALDALPDSRIGGRPYRHTPDTDRLLLKHWPRADKKAVAKKLGMSTHTARLRYRALQGDQQ